MVFDIFYRSYQNNIFAQNISNGLYFVVKHMRSEIAKVSEDDSRI